MNPVRSAAYPSLLAVPILATTLAAVSLAGPSPAAPLVAAPSPVSPSPAGNQITVADGLVRVRDRIVVGLAGWPAGTVQLELCGNAARRGVRDCAVAAAVHVYVPPSGSATVQFTVPEPPVGCPCVLRASAVGGPVAAAVPVRVSGITAPPAAEPGVPAGLRIAELRIAGPRGRDRLTGLFGLPTRITVELSVHNAGDTVVVPATTLLTGRPDRVTTIVGPPRLGAIPAGATRTYLIDVPLGAPAVGRYAVHGQVGQPGAAGGGPRTAPGGGPGANVPAGTGRTDTGAGFAAETSVYPWGLPALAALLLLARPAGRALRRRIGWRRVDFRRREISIRPR
ncbi:hypothetical protein O7627_16455 [Solwaraspora sp. WMMD1047]|uniref:hypothetical protein n=1 Tax=Solwaraspora sp. WMMD1047 TaxID=3016102 RepID=UPI002417FFB9|nr:hypothetical protein [Solwaraspora sp. WMMD1047]MDG4830889.1 hypothetical protein [Solwaraspora sp. WMMD1047]